MKPMLNRLKNRIGRWFLYENSCKYDEMTLKELIDDVNGTMRFPLERHYHRSSSPKDFICKMPFRNIPKIFFFRIEGLQWKDKKGMPVWEGGSDSPFYPCPSITLILFRKWEFIWYWEWGYMRWHHPFTINFDDGSVGHYCVVEPYPQGIEEGWEQYIWLKFYCGNDYVKARDTWPGTTMWHRHKKQKPISSWHECFFKKGKKMVFFTENPEILPVKKSEA